MADTRHEQAQEMMRTSIGTLTYALQLFTEAKVAHEGRSVFSIGSNAQEAMKNLAEHKKWGEIEKMDHLEIGKDFDWAYSFVAGGTSFKAAGVFVLGGAMLTWWK